MLCEVENNNFDKIVSYVYKNVEWVEESKIEIDTKLIDLGIDSIELMRLIVFIEDEFNINVEESVLENNTFISISDIINYVANVI